MFKKATVSTGQSFPAGKGEFFHGFTAACGLRLTNILCKTIQYIFSTVPVEKDLVFPRKI